MENNVKDLWKKIKDFLMENIDSQIYNSYLIDAELKKEDEKNFNIVIKKSSLGLFMLKNEISNIYDSLIDYLNEDIDLHFIEKKEDNLKNKSILNNEKPTQTFNNFVVGKSNSAAFNASKIICENLGSTSTNPLFIYGDSGLGKTHLLRAIKNDLSIKGFNVYYSDSMSFRSEYVKNAINKNSGDYDFIKNYDVLLIDDINLILSATKTIQYFYYVFNSYMDENKQIVISCDVSPNELVNLKNRIQTRLVSGLTVQIKKPDDEISRNLLINKLIAYDIKLENDIIEIVSKKLGGNGRIIEGFLNNLSFIMIQNNNSKVSISEIEDIIGEININGSNTKTNKDLFSLICNEMEVEPKIIIEKDKRKNIVIKRNKIIWLMKSIKKDITMVEIGLILNRSHTTISDSFNKIEENMRENQIFYKSMVALKKNIMNKMN